MRMKTLSLLGRCLLRWIGLACVLVIAAGAGSNKSGAGGVPETREWTVGGVQREALVFRPTKTGGPGGIPVIFAFHGHGGTMAQAARSFALQDQWPEALVIYPQGLKTPGVLTDPDGKRNGWQMTAGVQGDRDLAFFDAMLATVGKEPGIDANRIFATGHSNGGGFTYVLWAQRAEVFAAFAPVAATPALGNLPTVPKPVLHIAGKADPLVTFAWQERTIQMVRKLNGCGAGVTWPADAACTLYPSTKGAPVVTWVHDGGHKYPAEAPAMIVNFFKENQLP
jgi:polyhydroxybutyrate depolymerase